MLIVLFICFISPLSAIASSSMKNLKINNYINYIELFILIILTSLLYKQDIEGVFIAFFVSLILKYFLVYYLFANRINFNLTIFRPILIFSSISAFFLIPSAIFKFDQSITVIIFYSILWSISSWIVSINFFFTETEQLFILKLKKKLLLGIN